MKYFTYWIFIPFTIFFFSCDQSPKKKENQVNTPNAIFNDLKNDRLPYYVILESPNNNFESNKKKIIEFYKSISTNAIRVSTSPLKSKDSVTYIMSIRKFESYEKVAEFCKILNNAKLFGTEIEFLPISQNNYRKVIGGPIETFRTYALLFKQRQN